MTAIAYRDGVMAADSVSWVEDQILVPCGPKIIRLKTGLIACSGIESEIQEACAWIENNKSNRPDLTEDGGFNCLWIKQDKSMWHADHRLVFVRQYGEFTAIGASTVFMFGAMHAGASAEDAVRLAVTHTAGASGAVQVERL